jgi:hypothetical protein
MKVKSVLFHGVVLAVVLCCGCKSARELRNLGRCEFAFLNVSDVEYAGVRFNDIQSVNDIGVENVTRILAAAVSQKAVMSFNINVKVTNPTASRASVEGMTWKLFMDSNEMLNGTLPAPFAVDAQQSVTMSLRANLTPIVRGKAAPLQQIYRYYQLVTGMGDRQEDLTLKIKPIVNKIEMPYITLKLN